MWDKYIKPHAGVILLCLAAIFVFGQTLRFEFVLWDDESLIYHNKLVTPPSMPTLARIWSQSDQGLYIPVTYTCWTVLATVGRVLGGPFAEKGTPPWPFHLANLLAHIANVLLVYRILRRLKLDPLPAALGCSLFALHPLQVEAVAWATGMKDLLSTFLALLSVDAYLVAAKHWACQKNVSAHRYYRLALVSLVLASFAKPGIIGLPLIAGLLDALFVTGMRGIVLLRMAGLGLVLVPGIFGTYVLQHGEAASSEVSLALRPTVACHAIAFYVRKLLFPSGFCIDYGLGPLRVVTHYTLWSLGLLTPLLLAPLALFPGIRRSLTAVLGIMVAGVLPVLGLTAFVFQEYSTVADRYFYLSMLGASLGLALVASRLRVRVVWLVFVALLISLGALSFRQASYWQDTLVLTCHCLDINPDSYSSYNNMGVALCPVADQANWTQAAGKTRPGLQGPALAEKADECFRQSFAIRVFNNNLRNLILMRATHDRYAEALQIGELAWSRQGVGGIRAIKVADFYEMGWLYLQLGKKEKAAQWFLYEVTKTPCNQAAYAGFRAAMALNPTTQETMAGGH